MSDKQLIRFNEKLWKSGKYKLLTIEDNNVHVFEIFEGSIFYRWLFGTDLWISNSQDVNSCNLKMYKKNGK